MLQPGDEALVRRDRALPDLALLLDPERLGYAFARTTGLQGLPDPVVTYLRYKPGQSCLAACSVTVDGRAIAFSAKAHRPDAGAKLRKALERPAEPGPLGPGRFLLLDTAVVVSVFPNDAGLPSLVRLGSETALARLVHRIDPARAPSDVRVHTLRHNPERRYVGRLTAGGEDVAAVRCYTSGDYRNAADKAGALASRGPLRLARTLVLSHRRRLVVNEWLAGELLDDAIRRDQVTAGAMRLVGAALAEFHGQDAPTLPQGRGAFRGLRTLARDLGAVHPDLAAPAVKLVKELVARAPVGVHRLQPIHGDFYAKQILLRGDAVGVLDLDEMSLGDPAVDLARFQADLESAVVLGRLDAGRLEALLEPLLEGYRLAGREPGRRGLHVAAELLRVTTHPFRRREAAWPEKSAALLERARLFVDEDARAGAARVVVPSRQASDPFGVTGDVAMPFVGLALDLDGMGSRFTRELRRVASSERIDVSEAAVMRYKPGRRCLIAYDIVVRGRGGTLRDAAVVGKIRARGTDVSTDRLLRRLWRSGFGPEAKDGLLIPEPLGAIPAVHMTVQRRVAGEPVGRLLGGPDGVRLALRAAEAVHKLHALRLPARRRHSLADEIAILRTRLETVAEAEPGWSVRLAALLDGCARLAARVDEEPTCGVHRDFHPDQLLADGDRVHLLDLDLYSAGHPALDVGNFAAHIDEYSLREFGDVAHLADRREAVIGRYLELSGRATREAIEIFAALTLARHVAISRQFAERQRTTATLLDLAEDRILGASC